MNGDDKPRGFATLDAALDRSGASVRPRRAKPRASLPHRTGAQGSEFRARRGCQQGLECEGRGDGGCNRAPAFPILQRLLYFRKSLEIGRIGAGTRAFPKMQQPLQI
jgi:hypothetical protein